MCKPQNLDFYIEKSGYKIGFIVSQLGISRTGFDKKRKGIIPFKQAEIYVLCDLLDIPKEEINYVFFNFYVDENTNK